MHPERQDLLKMVLEHLEHPVRTRQAELTHPLMETATTIYRTEEICFGNRLHMQLGARKIWAGTLDLTGSHL